MISNTGDISPPQEFRQSTRTEISVRSVEYNQGRFLLSHGGRLTDRRDVGLMKAVTLPQIVE